MAYEKGMGNCLFIPSEGKIEYRNPCLFPGVGFSEAVAASFTHSTPQALALTEIKKEGGGAAQGTLLTAVSNTQPCKQQTRTEKSG